MKLQPGDEGHVDPLYEQRLLVFIEDIDRGVFNQVLLTAEQFKKVSDSIFKEKVEVDGLKKGFDAVEYDVGTRDIPGDIFNGCASINDKDEE